jgi:hypothetical protein
MHKRKIKVKSILMCLKSDDGNTEEYGGLNVNLPWVAPS